METVFGYHSYAAHPFAFIDEVHESLARVFVEVDLIYWFQFLVEEWQAFDLTLAFVGSVQLLHVLFKADGFLEFIRFISLET